MNFKLTGFSYFYSYLGYRVIVLMISSTLIGFMDSLGVSMMIPIFSLLSNDGSSTNFSNLGILGGVLSSVFGKVNLTQAFVLLGGFIFFKAVSIFVTLNYQVKIQQIFLGKVRQELIENMNLLKYDYFVTFNHGKLQSTFSGEVERVFNGMVNYFQAFQTLSMIFTYILIASFSNFRFSLLIVLSALLTMYFYRWLNGLTKLKSLELSDLNAEYQNHLISYLYNFKYILVSGYKGFFKHRLVESITSIEKSRRAIGFIAAFVSSLREPVVLLSIGTVVYFEVIFFGASISKLFVTLLLFFRALNYLSTYQNAWNRYLGASGSIVNLRGLVNELGSNKIIDGNLEMSNIDKIEFKNLSLSLGEKLVLNNISLTINKGDSVAFIGTSGSGKSSIVNVIAGLYSDFEGSYLINGLEIDKFRLDSVRRKIGYITQDATVFNDSIKNNITLWAVGENYSPERFVKAIEIASLTKFVSDYDKKEEAIIGSNGIDLSGGQKQRLSIAREVYKNPDILIFDEATSALDSGTELEIQQSINKLKGKHTLIIVAHRLSTIRNVDKIYLIESGQIINSGNFTELSDSCEIFQKMLLKQNLSFK